jgi:hypothetical protein
LLLPLHQAAGLQRDLDRLGFAAISSWSICVPAAPDENSDTPAALKCPAAGIGKSEFALPLPVAATISPPASALPVRYHIAMRVFAWSLPEHVGQPRAPPVAV